MEALKIFYDVQRSGVIIGDGEEVPDRNYIAGAAGNISTMGYTSALENGAIFAQ